MERAVPSCIVWMLLSMFIMFNPELQNKIILHLSAGTHSLGAAETLLWYFPNSIWGPTESTFHCNINFLVSIRSHLTPQFMLKIFPVKIGNWGCRTLYSFYAVKHPHPLCLHSSVTGDLCEMREKANRGYIQNV